MERLCNVHIPQWLSTDGMDTEKIAGFYDDADKRACEAQSLAKAYHLRSLSIDTALSWRAQRWARFILRLVRGIWRSVRARFSGGGLQNPAGKQSARPGHERLA